MVKQREKWIASTAHGQKSPVWQRGLSQLCLAKSLRWPDITCSPPQVKKNCGFDPRREYFASFFAKKAGSFLKKRPHVSGRLRVDPRREYFASRFAALPRPVVFLRKGAASVRGRLLVNPRCEYCASALLPAQCRFAAWAGGVSGWHNYDLFYNRASRAPNIGGFLLTRLLLKRLLLGPFWLERRLL